MRLDSTVLKEAGIADDTPITKSLKGISLRSALNLLLDDLQLRYVIHNEVLLITSPVKANSPEYLETRVYDVADLVIYRDENGKKFDDYGPLKDMITSTIDWKSWRDHGGIGGFAGNSLGTAKVLVVSQSYDVHEQIAALLAEIRMIAAKKSGGDGLPYLRATEAGPGGNDEWFTSPWHDP